MRRVKIDNIPAKLAAAPQWVLWQYEERDGKRTKPPFQPSGAYASHSDPVTWNTLEMVLRAYETGKWAGIGFVLSDKDPFAGVDLDHAVDAITGEIAAWALEKVEQVGSYTECSPSGAGLRIFLEGNLPAGFPAGGRKCSGFGEDGKGTIEVYDRLRYLTVTGRRLMDGPAEILPRQEAFYALCNSLPGKSIPKPELSSVPLALPLELTDLELQSQMFGARNGPAILALWNGDTSGHHGDDSAADLALCNHLAFYCGQDPARIDRLFRQSRLFRSKWDEKRGEETYGQRTIGTALVDLRETYQGPSQRLSEGAFIGPNGKPALTDGGVEDAFRLASAACEKLKEDPGSLFTPEILHALALLRRYRFPEWIRLRNGPLTKARLVKDVEAQLPNLSEPDSPGLPEGKTAGESLNDCPAPGLVIPSPYFVCPAQTGRWSIDETGKRHPQEIAPAPLLVSGRTRDAVTGQESLLLAWQWPRSGWQARVVPRGEVLSSRELLKLAGCGFPVGDDTARDVVRYLRQVEAANRPALPCAKVSSHLGWQGDPLTEPVSFLCGRALVLPTGYVETADTLDTERPEEWSEARVSFQGASEGQDQLVEAFHQRGTLDGWLAAIRPLAPYPVARLVLYTAFAAPLLRLLDCPNFVVDISHETTSGKTTVARAAASVWGNPDERGACSVVLTWDASRVGLERSSEAIADSLLVVDDTKKAKNERMVADLIYAVVSGRGRQRGTLKGLARTPVWRTIMLSTGEQSATSFTQDGGTRTRVLSLAGYPFGAQTPELARLADQVNRGLRQHYGHAASRFLAWLQQNRPTWPQWQDRYLALAENLAEEAGSPEAGRLAQYAALLSLAGEMAHRALPLPWAWKDPVLELWPSLTAEARDAAGSLRALEDILSWASSEESRFLDRIPHDGFRERTPPTVYGRWPPDPDWEYLAVYPVICRETLVRLGYSPEAILRAWRDRGFLKHREGRLTWNVPIGDGKVTKPMYCILRHAFSGILGE